MKYKKTTFFSALIASMFVFTPFVSTHAQDNPRESSEPCPVRYISSKKARLTRTGVQLMDKCDRVVDFIRARFSGNAGKNREVVALLDKIKHEKKRFKSYLTSDKPELYFCWLIEIMEEIYCWADHTIELAAQKRLSDLSSYGTAQAFVKSIAVEERGETRDLQESDCLHVSGYVFAFKYKSAKKFFMDMWDFQAESRLGAEILINDLEIFLREIKPGAYFLFIEKKIKTEDLVQLIEDPGYMSVYNVQSLEEAERKGDLI